MIFNRQTSKQKLFVTIDISNMRFLKARLFRRKDKTKKNAKKQSKRGKKKNSCFKLHVCCDEKIELF